MAAASLADIFVARTLTLDSFAVAKLVFTRKLDFHGDRSAIRLDAINS